MRKVEIHFSRKSYSETNYQNKELDYNKNSLLVLVLVFFFFLMKHLTSNKDGYDGHYDIYFNFIPN